MKAKDVKEREKVKKIETELSLKIIKPGDAGKPVLNSFYILHIVLMYPSPSITTTPVNYPKYGDSVSV